VASRLRYRHTPGYRHAYRVRPTAEDWLLALLFAVAVVLVETAVADHVAHAQESEDTAEVVEAEDAPVELGTALQVARVRLTHYVHSGITYSGQRTYVGGAGCSWDIPLGQRFRLPDGSMVVCNDRGMLGNGEPYSWLDLYGRADTATWGPYITVEVVWP
jgi:hypothetical protein